MGPVGIILIIIVVIVVIGVIIKVATRNKDSDGNIFERGSSVSKKFADCCRKIAKVFGGGA